MSASCILLFIANHNGYLGFFKLDDIRSSNFQPKKYFEKFVGSNLSP